MHLNSWYINNARIHYLTEHHYLINEMYTSYGKPILKCVKQEVDICLHVGNLIITKILNITSVAIKLNIDFMQLNIICRFELHLHVVLISRADCYAYTE